MPIQYKIPGLSILLFSALLVAGCKKDFINNTHPTDSANQQQVFESRASVRIYFNGIYRQLRNQWQSIDQSTGGSDDAYSYISVCLARVAKGKDIVMPYSGFYYFDYQNDNREPTYRRVRFTWYYFYELINQLNTLIQGTLKSPTINDDDKTSLSAEARALRADLYFELIREFQFTYLKDPNAPGVPIYTEATKIDSLDGKPRGTVQQVYDQISSDIAFALQHIGTDRIMKDQVNLNVVQGFAARIYLEQGRWVDAYAAARAAIDGYALDAVGYQDNYNGVVSDEIIWQFPQTIENGGQSLYYGTPSAFYEQSGAGYDVFWMSKELVDHFSPTDVRYTFYQYDQNPSDADYFATNKFGKAQNADKIELLNGSSVPYKTLDFNESINMMRVGEMYLV
nr:RagB/SusD family nutrient uptake outer membrane protein [Chitinophagaceae bacterium]